jgi:hypothetical protein
MGSKRTSAFVMQLRRPVAAGLVAVGLATAGLLAGVGAAPAGAQAVPLPSSVQSAITSLEGNIVGESCAAWWASGIPQQLHLAGGTCLIGSIPDGGLL